MLGAVCKRIIADTQHRNIPFGFVLMKCVSGQWVSPIEVENTLLEHSAVHEYAVIKAMNEQYPRIMDYVDDQIENGTNLSLRAVFAIQARTVC